MGIKTKTSFKKGQSGNPKGRPKSGNSWKEVLARAVDKEQKIGNGKKTRKEMIADVIALEALRGNMVAAKMIMDRQEGIPDSNVIHYDGDEDEMNLSKLTDAELEQYEKLMRKAAKK